MTEDQSQHVEVLLQTLEAERVKANKRKKTGWFVAGLILAVGVFLFVSGADKNAIIFWVIMMVVVVIPVLIINYFTTKRVKNKFKDQVLYPAIKSNYKDLTHQSKNYLSRDLFHHSRLFKTYADRYNGEDLFQGVRGKTAYKFSEIHAEERYTTTDSKGRTQTKYRTIFKGLFLMADFNKHFNGLTRVVEGGDGFFEKLFAGKSKVSLENPTFEKIFNTYSNDQVEARYILTPKMMEQILLIKEKWNSSVALSFRDNHVFIAITSYNNLFEPNMKQTFDLAHVDRIFEEIDSCLELIDILDLNTRIWTKR